MKLTDNFVLLKAKYPFLINRIDLNGCNDTVQVIETKSGHPTLAVNHSVHIDYLHSKYNPVHEAEKFIEQYVNVEHNHVLFYGVGLGYHIERFVKHFPAIPFSIYEPDIEVFRAFISHQNLNKWKMLRHIYVESNVQQCRANAQDFVNQTDGQVTIITLPSYERIYAAAYKVFSESMQHCLQEARKMFQVRHAFEKKWIINSLDNFKYTLQAGNIFDKKPSFEGKPILIVSAGPSLNEEIENLRYIKEHKSAYIFAVGSAISSLLHNGIIPDGACTYDPHFHNVNVIKKVIEEKIDSIPLIYGSTVGAGTLKDYPGPILSVFTDKDPVADMLLRRPGGVAFEKLEDAPSIAVIALQLCYHLGCNPIVMVGQNLGYRNNSYYAGGIQYGARGSQLLQLDIDDAFQVEDVFGDLIQTNWSFNTMRLSMEVYLKNYTDRMIINTTQGGAKIQGTQFMNLKDVMEQYLHLQDVVDTHWYVSQGPTYDFEFIREQSELLDRKYNDFSKQMETIISIFNEMNRCVKQKNAKKAFKLSQKFDSEFGIFQKNEYYKTILKPMNMLQLEWLSKQFDAIVYEPDMLVKTTKIIEKMGKVVYDIQRDLVMIDPLYLNMQRSVQAALNQESAMIN
ncbi:6-hydroxymethylpterin diphosphokinase MptE-like protein [Paenibacillus oryzisoli]|uniref:motility associated factor glycosyltransferase family protein n=1 Tax=Paenibacillus oryzisoli TaxID=1850517 RepID=UPI003D2E362C